MAVSVIETERKYEADLEAELPQLGTLPGVTAVRGPDLQELIARYYDTADLRLLRAGITLRRRTGGDDAGWHLKLPSGTDSREEIRLPAARRGRPVPAELTGLVRARTRGAPLIPVAEVITRRQLTTLVGRADQSLAEVADDRVEAVPAPDYGAPAQWREIEVELTGGDGALLAAADRMLRDCGLRRSARSAKLERVLGEQARAPARPAALAPSATAGEVIGAYLRDQAETLVSLDPQVRRAKPDSVHQMRVACRRLRSALRSFGTVVSRSQSNHLAAELRWLSGVLGDARDAEVQAERLAAHLSQAGSEELIGPVQEQIRAHAARARAASMTAVAEALTSPRYDALLSELDQIVVGRPAGPAARDRARTALPAQVARSYRKTRRRMRAALREPPGRSRELALHQARKAAKQARYAAEAAAPVLGRDAARFARQMKKLQAVLGDHQDTVVGRQLARQLGIAAQQAGQSAFSYGVLYGRDACEGARLQAKAARTWRKAARRRYRRWLR